MESRGRLIRTGLAVAAAWLCACAPALGAAVTYQGDTAHTGNVAAPFKPPLGKKWIRRDLGADLSYPVIGDGKVFVTAHKGSSGGYLLYALDRRTGATVWTRPVQGSQPAYDNGRVFIAGEKLQGYDSATGKTLWLLEPDAYASAPVADGATVFASGPSSVNSFEELTGAPVANSDGPGATSGVAVDGPRVYTSDGCKVSFFSKALGHPTWTYDSDSCSGGGYPPAVFGGRVWARGLQGAGVVLDQNLGLKTDSFTADGGLAFAGNLAFLPTPFSIQARRIDTGTIAWNYGAEGASVHADGSLLVVNNVLYAVVGGRLLALNPANRAELGTTDLGQQPATGSGESDTSYGPDHHGMAADASGLIVPTEGRLIALGPGGDVPHVDDPDKRPSAGTRVTVSSNRKYVNYPGRVRISGTVTRSGNSYSVSDRIELQAATYPYEVWRTVRSGSAESGSFSFSVKPDRNTRYRVVDIDTAPAVVSKVKRVTLYLGGRTILDEVGRARIRATIRLYAPPWLQPQKRGVFFYRLRSRRARHADRVAHLKLHEKKPGSYHTSGTFRVRRLRAHDLFYVCTPIKAWHEIARFRHKDTCGRKRE